MTKGNILRGVSPGAGAGLPSALAVSTAGARLIFDVLGYACGTLYIKTVTGSRTNGVIALKHGPAPNAPSADLQSFDTPITFTADGFSHGIDLSDLAYVCLTPTTVETGGTWIVEAWLVVKGDA